MRRTSSARSDDGYQWQPKRETTAMTNGIPRSAAAIRNADAEIDLPPRRVLCGGDDGASTSGVATRVLIHQPVKSWAYSPRAAGRGALAEHLEEVDRLIGRRRLHVDPRS